MISIFLFIILPAAIGGFCLWNGIRLDAQRRWNNRWVPFNMICGLLCTMMAVLVILGCTLNYISNLSLPAERQAIIDTRDATRNTYHAYENVALNLQIIEFNRELASDKYYGSFIALDIFYPDYIVELDYIK